MTAAGCRAQAQHRLLSGNGALVKITAIKPYAMEAYSSNFVFVKIETDEGIYGVGECTLESKEHSVLGAITECSRLLIGQDPLEIERLWITMNRYAPWKGAALFSAMSGLEHALWDISGKYHNVPAYKLMGGAVRERVRAYTWPGPYSSPQELGEAARAAFEAYGYRDFKIDPFTSYFTVTLAELRLLDECMLALRDAVPDCGIAVDGHWRFNPPAAIQIADVIEPYFPLFLEEPVLSDDEEALAKVRSRTNLTIATGERGFTRWGFWNLLKNNLADVFQPDLCHDGGILETRKIAAMAEPTGVMIAPHNPNGPVCLAATVQFAAGCSNFLITESVHTRNELSHKIVKEPLHVVDGHIALPTAPGLGIDLDFEFVESVAMNSRELVGQGSDEPVNVVVY
jgi:galactonate dehydratase